MASKGGTSKRKGSGMFNGFLGSSDKAGKKENEESTSPEPAESPEPSNDIHKGGLKKLVKKSSIFSLRSHIDEVSANQPQDRFANSLSPQDKPERSSATSPPIGSRTLQKVRPGSILNSLTNRHVSGGTSVPVEEEIDDSNGGYSFPTSPVADDIERFAPPSRSHSMRGRNVQLHGEVQTTSGLFRKKKEYLVLTDTHLLRYKSQAKAADAFPNASISPSHSRSNTMRQSSTASIGSIHDLQSLRSHGSVDGSENAILLRHVIATYRNDQEGKNIWTADIVHLDEDNNSPGSLQITLATRNDADIWHSSIRAASQKARLIDPQSYPPRVVEYLVRIVTAANDFDPQSFNVFRVVRRLGSGKGTKASSDDLKGLSSNVYYMVVGMNQIHLISLPDFSEASTMAMDMKASRQSFGLVTLIGIGLPDDDDKLELSFRLPMQLPVAVDLAAASASEIVTLIHKSLIYIKPQWLDFTYLYGGPSQLIIDESPDLSDDLGWFDRTLIAYCSAYNCDPSRICYAIANDLEEGCLEFRLLSPRKGTYNALELLAVFRALRYNEGFSSISFVGTSLQALYGIADIHGKDHVAVSSRNVSDARSTSRPLMELAGRSLLYQETRALALKATRLRKLDFSGTLPRKRLKDTFDEDGEHTEKDPGCDFPVAIFPLVRARWTNIHSIVLNGIELAETDLDEISRAFGDSHKVKWLSLEVSKCGLTDHGLHLLFSALERQTSLQRLNLSDNPGNMQLNEFSTFTTRFNNLRYLNLSRALFAKGTTSLLDPDTLCSWRLEELILDGITLNENSIEAIIAYLSTENSQRLRLLQLEQCNLTGYHVAALMRSMCRGLETGAGRPLSLNVSNNRLEQGNGDIVMAIQENCTPHQLSMRMVNYNTESRFRQLLQALRANTSIKTLDISKASLPKDADEDTCLALRSLFEHNSTLVELDISGEQAHLETTRFGIGLSSALTGLQSNRALKVLKIEHQSLGMEGANTLASVMKENKGLESICCEHNGINQQGFRVLVEALAENYTLTYLPEMENDRAENIKNILKKLATPTGSAYSNIKPDANASAMHGVLGALSKVGISKPNKDGRLDTPQNQQEVQRTLGDAWQTEINRMRTFLRRNRDIADGLTTSDLWRAGNVQELLPTIPVSEADVLHNVLTDITPRDEIEDPIEDYTYSRPLDIVTEERLHNPPIESTQTPPEIIVGSYDSANDMAHLAAASRAYESHLYDNQYVDDDNISGNTNSTTVRSDY